MGCSIRVEAWGRLTFAESLVWVLELVQLFPVLRQPPAEWPVVSFSVVPFSPEPGLCR